MGELTFGNVGVLLRCGGPAENGIPVWMTPIRNDDLPELNRLLSREGVDGLEVVRRGSVNVLGKLAGKVELIDAS